MVIQTATKNLTTTNATTTTLWAPLDSGPFNGVDVQYTIYIHANEPATGDQQIWALRALYNAGNNTVSSGNMHSQTGDAGGSGWAVEITNTGTGIEVEVTGEASHTINWSLYGVQSVVGYSG